MPPEGYSTVTLPHDLIETIDGLTDMSRAATIRMLVAEYQSDTAGDAQQHAGGLAEGDVRNAVRQVINDELSHEQLNAAIMEQSQKLDSVERTLENMGGQR